MTYEVFMLALVKLADFKFPELTNSESLKIIVQDYFLKLYTKTFGGKKASANL